MAIRGFDFKGIVLPAGTGLVAQEAVQDLPLLTMTLARALDGNQEIRGTTDGSCVSSIVASYSNGYLDTAAITLQDTGPATWAMLFASTWKDTSTYNTFTSTQFTVPGNPYEYTNATLLPSGAVVAGVQVSILTAGTWGAPIPLEVITTGSPTVAQVLLTAASNKLTFNSALAGAVIKLATVKALTSVQTLGVEVGLGDLAYKTMTFKGKLCTTETGVEAYITAYLQLTGEFSVNMGGGGDQTLNAKVVRPSGKKSSIELILV